MSSACNIFRAQHPRGPRCSFPRKIHLGGSMLANKTFLFVDQSSRDFFPWNAEGIAVDQISFRFWISGVVSEIFAIKVESCQKSRWILDVFFALPKFRGQPSKSYTYVMTLVLRHVVWRIFCGDTPTSPEVIVAKTLNFKANFKFSRSTFLGGPPSHFGCALSRLGQSLARVTFSGRSTPYGLKYSLRKSAF